MVNNKFVLKILKFHKIENIEFHAAKLTRFYPDLFPYFLPQGVAALLLWAISVHPVKETWNSKF